MVTVLNPRRIRSVAALAFACAAVLPLTAACGGGGNEPPQWADGVSASESPTVLPTPTEVGPTTSAPTPTAVRTSRPATTTSAPASRPRTMGQRSTLTVSVSGGLGQSRAFTGIHQDGCGNPSWGLVTVRVGSAANVSSVAFRYQVRTPVPFNGSGSARTLGDDRGSWLASLGPFRADSRNSAGGTINVTAEAKFKDGSTRTAKTSTSLKACRR
ncbi:hypothetical protein [Plantactinospora soyae]|uniref:Uncharacterized protein n=1 Tax=Plantactinospora soyae TaxID=1544732 RepID=A0A927M5H7_9ACTN|nr:hypothetical protein [Plantactinospora soyae]MBE1488538.1 hypothetical protein [Plantactinospora soyae]